MPFTVIITPRAETYIFNPSKQFTKYIHKDVQIHVYTYINSFTLYT